MHTQIEFERGMRPSVIEEFSIYGLHGYRNLSITSKFAATIIIAPNGAGKTTLLGALDAFLCMKFLRLRDLSFDTIFCRLRGISRPLELTQEDLAPLRPDNLTEEFIEAARFFEISTKHLLQFLVDDYDLIRDDFTALYEDKIGSQIVKKYNYLHKDTIERLDKLKKGALNLSPNLQSIAESVRTALDETEIVYLPTYRRIEVPFEAEGTDRSQIKNRRSKFKFPSSAFAGDMQFGLADISERLSDLNQQILVESNSGYREISSAIVSELLDGTFDRTKIETIELPSSEDIELFFTRIREGGRRAPIFNLPAVHFDKVAAAIEKRDESNRFLLYFLSKLNKVFQATKTIELQVESFIQSCNKYLSNLDKSTSFKVSGFSGLDEKELQLDRKNLSVSAVSLSSGRKISMDALSSGEKQMISLFAKLHLYPDQKIFLIDEPELSLSIDWQKEILVDVIKAQSCRQIVAITHSPFIFDNALEPFAQSIHLSVSEHRPDTNDNELP